MVAESEWDMEGVADGVLEEEQDGELLGVGLPDHVRVGLRVRGRLSDCVGVVEGVGGDGEGVGVREPETLRESVWVTVVLGIGVQLDVWEVLNDQECDCCREWEGVMLTVRVEHVVLRLKEGDGVWVCGWEKERERLGVREEERLGVGGDLERVWTVVGLTLPVWDVLRVRLADQVLVSATENVGEWVRPGFDIMVGWGPDTPSSQRGRWGGTSGYGRCYFRRNNKLRSPRLLFCMQPSH